MPRGKRDISVILFDLNTESHEKAIQTLMKICCNKFFVKNDDLTKLILFNSDVTENRLSSRHPGYDNIFEASPEMISYNPKFILEKIENSGTGVGNWLESVVLGLRCLQEDYEESESVVTYQILLITDFTKHCVRNVTLFDKIVTGINELNAFFYIVGPEIEPPFMIKNSDDVKAWMNNFQIDESNVDLKVVKDIIQETNNSVVCSYDMGWQLFFSYRNYTGSQPWQVPLAIGTEIQLPAQTVKILENAPILKFASPRFGQMRW